MKIAVIGAGFGGLSVAFHLLSFSHQVTLFDHRNIGEGTSSVASGLIHPFPGSMVKTSLYEKEGREKTRQLIQKAAELSEYPLMTPGPLLRVATNKEQEKTLTALMKTRDDLRLAKETWKGVRKDFASFWIDSGFTVHSKHYLKALFKLFMSLKGQFEKVKIQSLDQLTAFDHIVLATGSESDAFLQLSKRGFTKKKGQILEVKCDLMKEMPSIIGKGYLAKTDKETFHLGSTYEKHFQSPQFDQKVAESIILDNARTYLTCVDQCEIIGGSAGVRFAKRSHYLPFVTFLKRNLSVITAFGSRGLLYHALCGEMLAKAIDQKNPSLIPSAFQSE